MDGNVRDRIALAPCAAPAYSRCMTIAAFDTLAYARRLKEAGVDEAQAEAHAEAVRDAIAEGGATKADIIRLEAKIDAMKWVVALHAALTLAMAGRLFGAF